ILKAPNDQQLSLLIKSFNTLISQVYGEILANPKIDITEILEKLMLVLTLNKEKAIDLGVYPTLLGTLATKIPRTQTHKLYSDYLEELVQERTKRLEEIQEKLLQSQRLAVIGEAAAMVGHDLRNPLQVIVYTLFLAEKKLEASNYAEIWKSLQAIKEQVKYMNKIISDLQDYARPLKLNLTKTDLPALIHETLVATTVPPTVDVSLVIEEDLQVRQLMLDALLLKRVFINLITNALQAIPTRGHLTIQVAKTDELVTISFQDTGIGISEDNITKIFQPLFTTKARGQGLGLAVCKRLIEAHEGKITVTSTLGKGTTVIVHIPFLTFNAFDTLVGPLPRIER
ncbi:MAG: ATP-binding protein, partial [Desulfobacterales bacterium]|nr:ATP-binding protein [Desulfobacterales bacterium]